MSRRHPSPRPISRGLSVSSHAPASAVRPIALAVHLTFSAAVLGAALWTPMAQAQQAEQARQYNIPAGSLNAVLNRFAEEAGVLLGASGSLTSGKSSAGLNGSYGVTAGFAAVLARTGLEAFRQNDGSYGLRTAYEVTAEPASAVSLQTVTVSGKAPGSTTEGTGSYTTRSSSSSTRLNLAPKETPQSLTVVTRQQLDDMKATTLADVIDVVPGLHVAQNGIGSDIYGYHARGFEIRNFEVDGVPTDNGLNLFTQNPVIYDRVEVVRGATGLISGMGFPAATINLIRKRPTLKPQASISVDGGNWRRRGATIDAAGKLNESGSVRARVVADVREQQGWVDRFQQQSGTLYGIAEIDLDDATLLTVGFNHQRSDADAPQRWGLPAAYADGTRTRLARTLNYAPSWSYNNQHSDGVFASVERDWGNGWTGKAEYSYAQNDYDFTFAAARGTLRQDGSGTTLQSYRWAGKPQQHNLDLYMTGGYTLFGREHELIGGLTLSRYDAVAPNYAISYANPADGVISNLFTYDGNSAAPRFTVNGDSTTRTRSDAAYASTRLHLSDDFKLILGGRFVRWSRDVDNWSTSGSSSTSSSDEKVFVPYAGAVYDLNPQWALYGSVTKIFSPQGQYVIDTNRAAVDPLEGTGYEVGVKGSHFGGRLNSSAALFLTRQDNLAVWNGATGNYSLEQSTKSKGMEFEVSGELARNWQLAAGYTHTRTTDAHGEQVFSFIPRNSVKLHTNYRLSGALQGLTVGGGLRWQSKTGSNGVWQGRQAVASLMARYEIDRNLSVALNVDNLFDRTYYAYPSANSTYAAPRSVMLSAKYNF